MQIGPRYKKARYLGIPVFKKTQTQKYAIRTQAKLKTQKKGRRGGKSEYGAQLLEKQKARFSYGIASGQFANYVGKALKAAGDNTKNLIGLLESRLDNVALRAGFASSRSAARQMVAHGHLCVNGTKVTVPSYNVQVGDVITIREGSKKKALFAKLDEEIKDVQVPAWIKMDIAKKEAVIDGQPTAEMSELLFDVKAVLGFYTR